MSTVNERWSLGAKLALTCLPFVLVGLVLTGFTLWVSWQLDGGAAAVNEAGRLRMQAYRLAWTSVWDGEGLERRQMLQGFDRSIALLERGDVERPLFVPWDAEVRRDFSGMQSAWQRLRQMQEPGPLRPRPEQIDQATAELVARIDQLVSAVERHIARYTAVMHLLQISLLLLGLVAAAVLMVVGYRYVLEPVADLKQAVASLRGGDLAVRVEPATSDELGALAVGFNEMAERLQASYAGLEARVSHKTAELEDQRTRLQALYDISLLLSHTGNLQELAAGFCARLRHLARADAAALRWADVRQGQFVLLAGDGLPAGMASEEHCIRADECLCGHLADAPDTRVIPIRALPDARRRHCELAGWATVVALPIRAQDRLLAELNLFFAAQTDLSAPDRVLFETACSHLATAMESLRLQALEKEAAVAEERGLLARELHDSIAQSLASLHIQAQLMRRAMARDDRPRMSEVLAEIELGLQESHGDVRELLVHFRTRTNTEDIEAALQVTLSKFERQSGVPATLTVHGYGLPLPSDVQVQALHVVQEALSNVRKHAQATHVRLDVWKQPVWRFQVRDDGLGFNAPGGDAGSPDGDTHVGLHIMRERAQRMGARLELSTEPGQGTTMTLTLAQAAGASPPPRQPAV
jgi:two-component system nitrate/nitrite sensor histidine kinase NarX